MIGYLANADAADAIGMPPGAPGIVDLLQRARTRFGSPDVLCPHASGTASHAAAEPPAILEAIGTGTPLCLLKPFLGHGIGGGGLLEAALLAGFLRRRELPAPMESTTCPAGLSMTSRELPPAALAFKLASALGGKNALVALQAP
jgi:3-oxoacyl-(acyl-carrier-protein) synthase